MGWNGSKVNTVGFNTRRDKGRNIRSYHHVGLKLLIGIVLLILVAIPSILILAKDQKKVSLDKCDKAPRHTKNKVHEQHATSRTLPLQEQDNLPAQRVGELRDGMVLMPNGELRKIKGEVTNLTARTKAPYAIFNHSSENIIAGLLVARPGMTVVGTPHYNGVFTKNFLKSLEEPIIVKETDDEDTKTLKRAVNDAKIELKAAYDRGEDIEQIVLDSRTEFQRLAKVREHMKLNVLQMAQEEAARTEDVDDLVTAANKILEDNGIAPIDDTPLMTIKLRLMKEQEFNNQRKDWHDE